MYCSQSRREDHAISKQVVRPKSVGKLNVEYVRILQQTFICLISDTRLEMPNSLSLSILLFRCLSQYLVPGGGGGNSHIKGAGMFVGNFELNP